MQKIWTLAKGRSELEIEGRKTLELQITTLQDKLQRDRAALDKLIGTPAPAAAGEPAKGETAPAGTPLVQVSPAQAPPSPPPAPTPKPAAAPTANPLAARLSVLIPTATPVQDPAAVAASPPRDRKPNDQVLVKAEHDAEVKAKAALDAEQDEMSVTDRLEILKKSIELQQKSLDTSRKLAANAIETHRTLAEILNSKSVADTPPDQLERLVKKTKEAEDELVKYSAEVRSRSEELDRLQSQRASLLSQQMDAKKKAEAKQHESAAAAEKVQDLQNPFTLRNILLWLIDHGPRILAVVLAMVLCRWLTRQFSRRFVQVMAHAHHHGTATDEEREARANTLVGVFHNAVSLTITVGGSLMILQEADIPIAPLLGGAAIFGLAVAFGAQNLIRDYFYGFVILLENQYKLNDVIKIGDISGQVEQITLRMTVLRDLEGNVHFVPNGQVTTVTNMTHTWSRAVFDVSVAANEDLDRVMAEINELGEQIRNEPPYSAVILEPLTMLGVDALADAAVTIKFYIKTRPMQQWTIRRELLRRIKLRFDSLGIQAPFSRRTDVNRCDEATPKLGAVPNPHRLRNDAAHTWG